MQESGRQGRESPFISGGVRQRRPSSINIHLWEGEKQSGTIFCDDRLARPFDSTDKIAFVVWKRRTTKYCFCGVGRATTQLVVLPQKKTTLSFRGNISPTRCFEKHREGLFVHLQKSFLPERGAPRFFSGRISPQIGGVPRQIFRRGPQNLGAQFLKGPRIFKVWKVSKRGNFENFSPPKCLFGLGEKGILKNFGGGFSHEGT